MKLKSRTIILITIIVASFIIIKTNNKSPTTNKIKEGDVVFQTSKNTQSLYIIFATNCIWNHCGMIIEKNNELYVLEASKKVKLTPYATWVKKGRGELIKIHRYSENIPKIKYNKYIDKEYDMSFNFNNNKWYCSELVYDIYKKQLNIEICKPRPISDYNILGLDNILKQRNIKKSQLVVAPSDLYNCGVEIK